MVGCREVYGYIVKTSLENFHSVFYRLKTSELLLELNRTSINRRSILGCYETFVSEYLPNIFHISNVLHMYYIDKKKPTTILQTIYHPQNKTLTTLRNLKYRNWNESKNLYIVDVQTLGMPKVLLSPCLHVYRSKQDSIELQIDRRVYTQHFFKE